MKLFILALISPLAMAQTSVTKAPNEEVPSYEASKGFRVSLFSPILEFDMSAEYQGQRQSSQNDDLGRTVGIAIGYAYLPVRALGFTTSFGLMDIQDDTDGDKYGMTLARLDGNLAMAVNRNVYFKGGLNVSNFTQSQGNDLLNPFIGYQAAVGIQFTPMFGAEVGMVSMTQKGETEGVKIEVTEAGPEFSLNATF